VHFLFLFFTAALFASQEHISRVVGGSETELQSLPGVTPVGHLSREASWDEEAGTGDPTKEETMLRENFTMKARDPGTMPFFTGSISDEREVDPGAEGPAASSTMYTIDQAFVMFSGRDVIANMEREYKKWLSSHVVMEKVMNNFQRIARAALVYWWEDAVSVLGLLDHCEALFEKNSDGIMAIAKASAQAEFVSAGFEVDLFKVYPNAPSALRSLTKKALKNRSNLTPDQKKIAEGYKHRSEGVKKYLAMFSNEDVDGPGAATETAPPSARVRDMQHAVAIMSATAPLLDGVQQTANLMMKAGKNAYHASEGSSGAKMLCACLAAATEAPNGLLTGQNIAHSMKLATAIIEMQEGKKDAPDGLFDDLQASMKELFAVGQKGVAEGLLMLGSQTTYNRLVVALSNLETVIIPGKDDPERKEALMRVLCEIESVLDLQGISCNLSEVGRNILDKDTKVRTGIRMVREAIKSHKDALFLQHLSHASCIRESVKKPAKGISISVPRAGVPKALPYYVHPKKR